MNATDFIQKWRKVQLTESAASQEHFLDLCALVGHPTPAAADPEGASFTFERGAAKRDGADGWADVWKKGYFGWEYKGKHKDLDAAHGQLLQYYEALEMPPLLVVCDMDRIVVHTHFNNTPHTTREIALAAMGEAENLAVLRAVFYEPDALKPGVTDKGVTEEAARHIAEIAQSLRTRGLEPHAVARFLDRIVFCLFAEDVGLLPQGLFSRIVDKTRDDAPRFAKMLGQLFDAMAHGGDFGMESIPHFNGDLFTEAPALDLTLDEIESVYRASKLDWAAIQPSIFGTLFERGLDPSKRSQLGAHYTSREDIVTLVEPVVMQPLRREWAELRETLDCLLSTGKKLPVGSAGFSPSPAVWSAGFSPYPVGEAGQEKIRPEGRTPNRKPLTGAALAKARDEAAALVNRFRIRLSQVKVLDPACGSGNFLYVTLQLLKDLEKAVITYAADHDLGSFFPYVLPTQLYGIEINPYAYELAQMTVWIGHLQWNRNNGFDTRDTPILRPMHNFECKDAILDLSDPENPKEPEWPRVDFIVGNPPFLGNKRMRSVLGDDYASALWGLYGGRINRMADLCCYWFEKARGQLERSGCRRAGLLATTGIKQVGSRAVIERIAGTAQVFFAVSDRDWLLDGSAVRISMIGFGEAEPGEHAALDGKVVNRINADLTAGCDATRARKLLANAAACFMGTTKVGAFDIQEPMAIQMLRGTNPHGRPNSDVLRPFKNGSDLVRTDSGRWIIDFGVDSPMQAAALYEAPFEYLCREVKPDRETNKDKWRAEHWWLLGRTVPTFRKGASGLARYIGTPRVSLHRVFVWLDSVVLPDSKVIAITRSADDSLGVIQSKAHSVWTLATCGWHGQGNDVTYNPTICFETFPFPHPTPEQEGAIGEAARELDQLREAWLNPPEWTRTEVLEFPGTVGGPWTRYIAREAGDRGSVIGDRGPEHLTPNTEHPPQIGLVRYPRLVAKDAECAKKLKARTLTNLYNERPTWLDLAHKRLDEAVFAAYGWNPAMSDEEILERLLALNLERATQRDTPSPCTEEQTGPTGSD